MFVNYWPAAGTDEAALAADGVQLLSLSASGGDVVTDLAGFWDVGLGAGRLRLTAIPEGRHRLVLPHIGQVRFITHQFLWKLTGP